MISYRFVVGHTRSNDSEKPYLYCLKLENKQMIAYRVYDAFVLKEGKFYYQKDKAIIKDDLDKELLNNFHRDFKGYYDFGSLPNGNVIICFEDIPQNYYFNNTIIGLVEIPHI